MKSSFAQFRQSRIPQVLGLCATNTPELLSYCNEAQQRLINAAGETGWYLGWQRVVFNVTKTDPYITIPFNFARIINLDVCTTPIRIQNEFYEFLPDGIGWQTPTTTCPDWCGSLEGYERGSYPTMVDLTTTNQTLRVYATELTDVGKKILVTGLDQNGLEIWSDNGTKRMQGFFMEFTDPFIDSPFIVTQINSIQKDITNGDITLFQVDSTTGTQVLLSRYGPYERVPQYRRYYIKSLPDSCCGSTDATIQVTALVKLEFTPAMVDTDMLLIGNLPALKEECMSIRMSEMDDPNAQSISILHHKNAMKLLRDEMRHYMGEQHIAVHVDRGLGLRTIGTLT